MFHLGWFVGSGFGPQAWNDQWSGTLATEWTGGGFYTDLARSLERAFFDYLILDDGLMITDTYRGTMEVDLAHAWESPRLDPMAAVAVMSQATSRIGLVATVSTSFYPPFMAARMLASLDHLSAGRVGRRPDLTANPSSPPQRSAPTARGDDRGQDRTTTRHRSASARHYRCPSSPTSAMPVVLSQPGSLRPGPAIGCCTCPISISLFPRPPRRSRS